MKDVSFIPKIIRKAKDEQTFGILGQGNRLQDYIDVRDAALLCKKAGQFTQNLILLGVSGNHASNKEVAELVVNATGAKINYFGEDSSPSFYFDVEDSYTNIDFQPAYTLGQTIKEMIQ
jgi:nucleoside-diphosphate-sugar epimerase